MATIKDYLRQYKDISFQESPFNEMDNLFFTQLSYFNWSGIVPSSHRKIPMIQAVNLLLKRIRRYGLSNEALFIRGCLENLKIIKGGKRYQNCMLSDFVYDMNSEKQFGAICIHLNLTTLYVSFEGTDNSVGGWKEDFELSYKFPVESQLDSIEYLKKVVRFYHRTVYVGGHSKGGNLAMVAAMYTSKKVQKKIKAIFNIDGPGFRKKEFESNSFKTILPKLKMYVPRESMIGLLLFTPPIYKVVAAYSHGFRQHDTNYWKCSDSTLINSDLSHMSKIFDTRVADFLLRYSDAQREKMLLSFFKVLENCGVKTLDGIRYTDWHKVFNVIRHMKDIDEETRHLYLESFKFLIVHHI